MAFIFLGGKGDTSGGGMGNMSLSPPLDVNLFGDLGEGTSSALCLNNLPNSSRAFLSVNLFGVNGDSNERVSLSFLALVAGVSRRVSELSLSGFGSPFLIRNSDEDDDDGMLASLLSVRAASCLTDFCD
jgi:hypothetical protein